MDEKYIFLKLGEFEMKIFGLESKIVELENKISELEKKSININNNEPKKEEKTGKDYTSYKFMGNTYKKSRLVLAVVKHYVNEHPGISASDLNRAFSDKFELVGKYVCTKLVNTLTENEKREPRRYFWHEDEAIKLNSGEVVAVCTQWDKKMIDSFIKYVKEHYGYEIEEIPYSK